VYASGAAPSRESMPSTGPERGLRRRQPVVAYIPAFVWAAYLLFLGSQQLDVPLPELPLPTDKIGHFVLYGGLGFFATLGWRWAGRRPAKWIPMILSMLVGAIDELHQRVVPTRSSDWIDWLVDVVAIAIAFAVFSRKSTPTGSE
jgi:VanZ family protein